MAARFLTPLNVQPIGKGRKWIVETPLVYASALVPEPITVPAGFVTDFSSVPRFTWFISPPSDYPEAGALHDFLYRTKAVPRGIADATYREALQVLGMGKARRGLRFAMLRLFGWRAYRKVPVAAATQGGQA